ncbi:MAG: nitroreductase family protein [Muribaculaceae bacterium]|nr:nitroreductase family protein [Muribaculaceae bacterium]
MPFNDLCLNRYSCRAFSSQNISEQDLNTVLEAARMAPSACNRQPWRFYVVQDEDKRQRLLAKSRPSFMQAPMLIVAVGLHDEAWHRPSDGKDHTDVDVSIAVEHICLGAADLGLGTCWVCSFDVDATRHELDLAEGEEPIALIPIGYPADATIPEKKRKDMREIVTFI